MHFLHLRQLIHSRLFVDGARNFFQGNCFGRPRSARRVPKLRTLDRSHLSHPFLQQRVPRVQSLIHSRLALPHHGVHVSLVNTILVL